MDPIYFLLIGLTLAMDAFAASISCGMTLHDSKFFMGIKVGSMFGLFQGAFFVIGWSVGSISRDLIYDLGNWLAFGLLLFIGARMIYEALKNWNTREECRPLNHRDLLILSVATSIDALVVGMSFGILGLEIWIPAIIITVVTLVLSFLGVSIGDGMRAHLDRWAEIAAGTILIAIAIGMLI